MKKAELKKNLKSDDAKRELQPLEPLLGETARVVDSRVLGILISEKVRPTLTKRSPFSGFASS